jgi:hypothetical protein
VFTEKARTEYDLEGIWAKGGEFARQYAKDQGDELDWDVDLPQERHSSLTSFTTPAL